MLSARVSFTAQQKAELGERWRSGQCIADIARALERRNKSGVDRVLGLGGGISPGARRRAPIALRLEEREEISRGVPAGQSIRGIARSLQARSSGATAAVPTGPVKRICAPGRGHNVRSAVAWSALRSYDGGPKVAARGAGWGNAPMRCRSESAPPRLTIAPCGSLGRRPALGREQHPHGHAGGTPYALSCGATLN